MYSHKNNKTGKMNGYKRIKSLKNIESLELVPSPKTIHKTAAEDSRCEMEPPQEMPSELEYGGASTERRLSSGAHKFRRNLSTSSYTSMQRSAVKRVFSMRRSSSVSERYSRIHDQHVALSSPPQNAEFEQGMEVHSFRSPNKVKKSVSGRKRILKSFKRIFGL